MKVAAENIQIRSYHLKNGLVVVGALIAAFASLLTILTYYTDQPLETVGSIVGFVVIAMVAVIQVAKLTDLNRVRFEVLSQSIHGLNHLIRDAVFGMQLKFDSGIFCTETLADYVSSKLQDSLNTLSYALTASTGSTVLANVKLLEPQDPTHAAGDETLRRIVTIARSQNSPARRWDSQRFRCIKDYYGFESIIFSSRDSFFAPDLLNYVISTKPRVLLKEKYKTHNDYRGAVSVPIRIQKDYYDHDHHDRSTVYFDRERGKHFYLIGLLSVDAKSQNAFRPKHRDAYVDLLKAYSNGLFALLDKYYYLDRRLREQEGSGE